MSGQAKLTVKPYIVVGGNAVSAFLSWRLQATNACDVTLVWKSGFDAVSQYGISFRYGTDSVPLCEPLLIHTADLSYSVTKGSSQDMVTISRKTTEAYGQHWLTQFQSSELRKTPLAAKLRLIMSCFALKLCRTSMI